MKNYIIYLTLSLVIFNSCNDSSQEEKVLAQVFKSKLFEKDLVNHIPQNLVKADSVFWVHKFIEKWIKEQVILHEANKVLNENQKNKEKQLEEYKKELLIYEFEKDIVKKNADTLVSIEDIKKYYNANRKEFELRKNITRLHYIKLRKDVPGIDKVKEWFMIGDSINLKKLESYCAMYAENYFFNDKVWLAFDDILKEIPLSKYNEEEFLKNNKKTILQDGGFAYLIDIIDFRIKNDVSPIEFELDNIKSILSNKKKLKIVEDTELSLLRKAESNGYIKKTK